MTKRVTRQVANGNDGQKGAGERAKRSLLLTAKEKSSATGTTDARSEDCGPESGDAVIVEVDVEQSEPPSEPRQSGKDRVDPPSEAIAADDGARHGDKKRKRSSQHKEAEESDIKPVAVTVGVDKKAKKTKQSKQLDDSDDEPLARASRTDDGAKKPAKSDQSKESKKSKPKHKVVKTASQELQESDSEGDARPRKAAKAIALSQEDLDAIFEPWVRKVKNEKQLAKQADWTGVFSRLQATPLIVVLECYLKHLKRCKAFFDTAPPSDVILPVGVNVEVRLCSQLF